jgi:hypothetical protein
LVFDKLPAPHSLGHGHGHGHGGQAGHGHGLWADIQRRAKAQRQVLEARNPHPIQTRADYLQQHWWGLVKSRGF